MSAVHEGVYVTFCVADEGTGVAPERVPHLFHKFTLDGRNREGSGLGLAICKGIVEADGGRIWMESGDSGLGSRFSFTIPAAGEATIAGPFAPKPSEQGVRKEVRVPLADDDHDACDTFVVS